MKHFINRSKFRNTKIVPIKKLGIENSLPLVTQETRCLIRKRSKIIRHGQEKIDIASNRPNI